MTQFTINNGEIAIKFPVIPSVETRSLMKSNNFKWDSAGKVWVGPYTPECEFIAQQIVASDAESLPQKRTEAVELKRTPVFDFALDKVIDKFFADECDDSELQKAVFAQFALDPDDIVNLINAYKVEAKAIESEKAAFEDAKVALKEIQARKKYVTEKMSALERMVSTYMKNNLLDRQKCKDYSLVLTTDKSYSLSKEFVADLIANLNLPEWLSVDVKLNENALAALESIPEGVKVTVINKLKIQQNLNNTIRESLELFESGLSIKEISSKRGLKWGTVYSHLCSAMSKGELELTDYISSDILEAIKTFHEDNPDTATIKEYVDAFDGAVKYDMMVLALKYLKITIDGGNRNK